MSVNFKIRSSIKRAIETGELLYLDYLNKNEENTFYFFGIKYLDFNEDSSKITGLSYNYQYKGYKQITIEIDRIKDARCVEGTKNLVESNLKDYIRVPKINNYFSDEINEKHILNYYVDCIENSDDLSFVKSYSFETFDLDMLKNNGKMKIEKSVINDILHMLNIDEAKAKAKYKLEFNKLSLVNHNHEIIPLIYYPVLIDVFEEELVIDNEELMHTKNICTLLRNYELDTSVYEGHIDQLIEDISTSSNKTIVFDENPQVFKMKLDLSLSPRKDYQRIKSIIYSKEKLTPVLQALFGKYKKPALGNNKNIFFVDNKVNSDQVMATYSAINNDLTYVQGPPGTGKSATIINMIVSSFMNKETTLVTSYTNSAVDNIYKKLKGLKYKQFNIPIPMLRIGSNEYLKRGLEYIKKANNYYNFIKGKIDLSVLKEEYEKLIEVEIAKLYKINNVIDENLKVKDVETKIDYYDKLISIFGQKKQFNKKISEIAKSRAAQKGQLTKINKKSIDNILDELKVDFNVISLGIFIKSIEAFEKFNDDRYTYLRGIIYNESFSCSRKDLYQELTEEQNLNNLLSIFPIFLTTNISTRNISIAQPSFDLLIMDEAGQCENAYAIVAMSKSKRAAFVGDPNQLLPVVTISDTLNNALAFQYSIPEVYNYKKTSILQTLNQIDFVNDLIVLKKHYRCRKSIINFANKKYYNNQLDIQLDSISKEDCKFVDVKSEFYQNIKNTSMPEVAAILEEIKTIPLDKKIGIISPYKNQADLISDKIKEFMPNANVSVGTVHKFQGQEKDVILLSLGVGKDSYKGSYDWIKNNRQLINVATTRPKEQLIVVGDKSSIEKLSENENSDLKDLINYLSDFDVTSFDNASVGFRYGNLSSKHLYTRFEDMFFDTLQRVINIHKKGFRINGQTDVKQVLKIHQDHPLYEYASKASFDFLILDKNNNVRLAIELCGSEHQYDQTVINRDILKNKLAKENGLEIIYVNNRDSRRYQMLKQLLIPILSR